MQKIPTLFVRDPENPKYVTEEVNPACKWVLDGEGIATRKYDGTCVMLDENAVWWARREVKKGKTPPPNFVEVEHDENTGKTMGWVPAEDSSFWMYLQDALGNPYERRSEGTYELVGTKVNGNPEGVEGHELVPHHDAETFDAPRDYAGLRAFLTSDDFTFEGIVWHHPDGRMAKLKKRDFPRA